jgi:hypothetical protein
MTGILNLLLGAGGVIKDTYFNLVSLLLPGNGTNGAQNNTFLDSSTNTFTITRNGNTTQGTFSPFSQTGWGNYFDGSSSLTPSSGAFLNLGTNPYTIEFFVYLTANSAANHLVAANDTNGLVIIVGNTKTSLNKFGVGDVVATGSGLSTNTWHHVAVVRAGTGSNQTSIYINGSQAVTGTDSNNWTVTTNPRVAGNTAGQRISGYISNLRVVTSALYSGSTINVPTAPFSSSQSGTTFLTCQSNRFLDNGTTGATFTVTGSPSVQAFSPFNPLLPWTAATNGGSGYFDGSGDWLSVADNTALDMEASDFTMEAWIYPTASFSANGALFSKRASNAVFGGVLVLFGGSNAPTFRATSTNSSWDLVNSTSSVSVVPSQWNHVAIARSGGNWALWVNGSRGVSATGATGTVSNNTAAFGIGANADGSESFPIPVYVAGARVVKGSAVYDPTSSTITVPTAPLTAITNTSLLLNYTNAGITDATAKNDLETVGNAQINTSVSKFGGGSIAFDGNGDWLVIPSSNLFILGTGDFTIEAWGYPSVVGGGGLSRGLFQITSSAGFSTSATNSLAVATTNPSGNWGCIAANAFNNSSTAAVVNTWYHLALVRNSGTTKLYVNGTSVLSFADTTNYTCTFLTIGGYYDTNNIWNGYIDDFRVTKGYARYTSNFTPPTAPFPVQ